MHTDEATTPDKSESDHSKTEQGSRPPSASKKFLDFLLSILGGAGNKVKSHAMAIMGGEGPGTNLVFYDRKLENIWNKRKEQERPKQSCVFSTCTLWIRRIEHRKWNRGRNRVPKLV